MLQHSCLSKYIYYILCRQGAFDRAYVDFLTPKTVSECFTVLWQAKKPGGVGFRRAFLYDIFPYEFNRFVILLQQRHPLSLGIAAAAGDALQVVPLATPAPLSQLLRR